MSAADIQFAFDSHEMMFSISLLPKQIESQRIDVRADRCPCSLLVCARTYVMLPLQPRAAAIRVL